MTKNLIVVLGMHRSGTSALTRSLSTLGVELGNNLLQAVKDNNEKGFFEDIDIVELNNRILEKLGTSWFSQEKINKDALLSENLAQEKFIAINILREKLAGNSLYAIKDPRFSILLPFWKNIFSTLHLNIFYIIATRHPASVARSLNRRDNFSLYKAQKLWEKYNISAIENTRNESVIIVEYDRILESTEQELSRISKFLRLHEPDKNSLIFREFSQDFLSETLRHFKAEDRNYCLSKKIELLFNAMKADSTSTGTQNSIASINTLPQECSQNSQDTARREAFIDIDFSKFEQKAEKKSVLIEIEKKIRSIAFIAPPIRRNIRIKKIGAHKANSLNEAKNIAKLYDRVSIDFFDTIVQRKIDPPETLKKKTAEFATFRLLNEGIYIHPERFLSIRSHIENRLRFENLQTKNMDHETCIKEIITESLLAAGLSHAENIAEEIINYEVETELNALRLQPGIVDFLEYCKENGIKIIVTSDMYLRGKDLRRIMAHFNIEHFFMDVLVSSDYGHAKYSGRLFHHTQKVFGESTKKTLHIGDNIVADVYAANQSGMAAAWLYEKENLHRRYKLRKCTAANEIESISNSVSPNKLFDACLRQIAPSVTYFCYKALYDAHKLGLRKLLFISREGVFLKSICETLRDKVALFSMLKNIEFDTLFASRMSTVAGAYQGHNSKKQLQLLIDKTIHRLQNFSIGNFLAVFCVPERIAPRHDREILNGEPAFTRLASFFTSQDGIATHQYLEEKKLELAMYLSQFGVDKQPIGLVDVGWGGTIQEHITNIAKDCSWNTKIYGFYLGSNSLRSSSYNNDSINRIFPGYIINELDQDIRTTTMVKAMPLLEICFTDPKLGTTTGYSIDNCEVKPNLEFKNDGDPKIYEATLNACTYFSERFSEIANLYPIADLEIRLSAREKLINLMTHPKRRDAELFGNTMFDFGWGEQDTNPLLVKIQWGDLFKPRLFTQKIMSSGWWQGSMAISGFGPGIFILNWYIYLRSKNFRLISYLKKTIIMRK